MPGRWLHGNKILIEFYHFQAKNLKILVLEILSPIYNENKMRCHGNILGSSGKNIIRPILSFPREIFFIFSNLPWARSQHYDHQMAWNIRRTILYYKYHLGKQIRSTVGRSGIKSPSLPNDARGTAQSHPHFFLADWVFFLVNWRLSSWLSRFTTFLFFSEIIWGVPR